MDNTKRKSTKDLGYSSLSKKYGFKKVQSDKYLVPTQSFFIFLAKLFHVITVNVRYSLLFFPLYIYLSWSVYFPVDASKIIEHLWVRK